MPTRRQLFLLQCFGIHWLFCQASGFPLTRCDSSRMMTHSSSSMKRRLLTTSILNTQTSAPSLRIDTALASLSTWRGGAALASSTIPSLTERIVSSSKACWVVLILTVILESCATSVSKQSRDLKSRRLFGLACAMYLLSMYGFNISLAQVPVGIAYAVWSALGTTLVTTMGIWHFGETMNWKKAVCLVLIVAGVVGLNVG